MKKVLAAALALVMLLAVSVPAFAADKVKIMPSTSNTADSKIITVGDATNDISYTVEIPAEMEIAWGNPETAFSYDVESQLATGKCLSIVVASSTDNNLVNVNDATKKLAYTLNGATAITQTTSNEVVRETKTFDIEIATSAWTAVPVDSYVDHLTFTVSIADL